MPKTVITIPVHNALPYVKRLFHRLDDFNSCAKIIVVNDKSEKETSDFLLESFFKGQIDMLVRHETQQLFTRSANHCLRLAYNRHKPTYIALLNSDIDLGADWLTSLEDILDDNPSIGLIGYRDGTPELDGTHEIIEHPGYITGHCLLFRVKMLEEIGVLAEIDDHAKYPQFTGCLGFAHIGSDVEYADRARKNGWQIAYCNAYDQCWHEAGKSWGHRLDWLGQFKLDPLWPPSNDLSIDFKD